MRHRQESNWPNSLILDDSGRQTLELVRRSNQDDALSLDRWTTSQRGLNLYPLHCRWQFAPLQLPTMVDTAFHILQMPVQNGCVSARHCDRLLRSIHLGFTLAELCPLIVSERQS